MAQYNNPQDEIFDEIYDETKRIYEKGYGTGYTRGKTEGYKQGYDHGVQDADKYYDSVVSDGTRHRSPLCARELGKRGRKKKNQIY